MIGELLGCGRCFQQALLGDALSGQNFRHPEHAFCQGAGLIEDHRIHLVKGFQIVASFHQHAMPGSGTDAAEEGQRHRKHQSTGAGNHQEYKGSVNPIGPLTLEQQGRQHTQKCRHDHHSWGIVTGKFGDEILRGRFPGGGILHHVNDLGNGGFTVGLCDLDGQYAAFIDAAGEDFVHRMNRLGNGFAGQRTGIHHGIAQQHHTVQGDLLAGLYHDPLSYRHILRGYRQQFAATLHSSRIRADVHQVGNGLPGALHSQVLEEFTHLVKQHDRHRFRVFSNKESADGGQAH